MRNAGDAHRIWCCALWMVVSFLAVVGLGGTSSAGGQTINREYKLKAAFLYKFTNYIRWPDEVFTDPESPLVIGILGPDPVGVHLRKIAAVKKVAGRKIEVRNFKQAEEVRDCHLLFISRGVKSETQGAALKQLSGRKILLVGETREFLKNGGVIDFVIQENRLRIFISKSAYQREGLAVSAHLLRIATVMN